MGRQSSQSCHDLTFIPLRILKQLPEQLPEMHRFFGNRRNLTDTPGKPPFFHSSRKPLKYSNLPEK
jgi:hypothetical protein